MPKRSEDAKLLAQFIRANDEAAFEQIVRKYESLVWNICCRVLHSRHDAEDAFQQTFLLLALKARRIRKPNSLSSWLYGVAFRTASSIRRQRQRDMLPYESMADESLTEDVLEYVARKNENELVSAEIMLMKEKLKTPLLMFYFMGDSTAQIAETLGTTISAVEGRLRQARHALRSQLRLRGVDFDTTCAALVVPIIAIGPALTAATINKVATASFSSIAGTITSYLTGLNQTGAKLMLSKLAISFSILCVTSLGVLLQEGDRGGGPQVTQVQNGEQAEVRTVGIKFVQDEDEPPQLATKLLPWNFIWNGILDIGRSAGERVQTKNENELDGEMRVLVDSGVDYTRLFLPQRAFPPQSDADPSGNLKDPLSKKMVSTPKYTKVIGQWRVLPGFGFKVDLPEAAPLEFDFAFPISDTEMEKIFSFSTGVSR